ncbi:TauD/TfdA family dioxygenase [Streptomyces sp. NPDC048623]|uniref:TauD/TfdA family dioxygenase n=1 Tax=Streptomyces sp. NPDC048623 TaxID=3155761 RepID=UPI003430AC3A
MTDLLFLDGRELTHGPSAPRQFAASITGPGAGRALVTFDGTDHERNLELGLSLLSSLGPILAVYPGDGCWSELSVREDADPGRTHGVGENRLHLDLVDRAGLPHYIALYCERDDPLGGGASALADLWLAADMLTEEDRELLSRPVFSYFADKDVHGVGTSLETFAVIPHQLGNAPVRFTAKMLPHLQRGELITNDDHEPVATAFDRLVRAAYAARTTCRLRPGQMLVFDQYRYAHGRMPLGEGQSSIPLGERRLLKQTYVGAPVLGSAL